MVRAKFKVVARSVVNDTDFTIQLAPVVGGSEENDSFYNYTPGGSITLATINAAAADEFQAGDEFYVDFTKAAAAPAPVVEEAPVEEVPAIPEAPVDPLADEAAE